MRLTIAMALGLASWAAFAADDYRELREVRLPADGVEVLVIDVDAGRLDVRGVPGQHSIEVRATIVVDDADEDEGSAFASERVQVSLDGSGEQARLVTSVRQPILNWGSGARVDVEVTVPPTMALRIDDTSGSIDIAGVAADVAIDDGSGSIDVRGAANLEIDDGSGSIDVSGASGDVYVKDGSGSITIGDVGGTVTIDDGSGSIRVDGVGRDLVIIDAGSGSVSFSGVKGTVEQDG